MEKFQRCILPKETALLIIDMQKGFLEENAIIPILNARKIVPPLINLIKFSRDRRLLIIWTKANHDNLLRGSYPTLHPEHYDSNGKPFFTRKSRHYDFIDDLVPMVENEDIIICKDRFSAFFQTNLELLLRQRGIENLLFTGTASNICVESSIRDAFERDFIPFMISDCTASFNDEMHKLSMKNVELVFGYVLTSTEIKKAIGQDK